MSKTKQQVDKFLGGFLSLCMALMVANVLWQVITRYLLNSPSQFTGELARFLLIWIGLLGAAYVSGRNQHISINLLEGKLSPVSTKRLQMGIHILIALFALCAFVIGGSRLVYITLKLEQTSSAPHVPLGYVYSIIPLSGLLIIYYKIQGIFTLKAN